MWNKAKAILLASNQEVNSLYGYKDKSLLFNYNKVHLYIINDR